MKSFLTFVTEAGSQAVTQAKRMGLEGDGHGGWYDKKGEFVAKTEKGKLVFYNKRQRVGQQDPAQTDKEKKLSHTTTDKGQEPESPSGPKSAPGPASIPGSQPAPGPESPPAPAKAEEPVRLPREGPPDVPKTKGTLTVAFGRFNPPHAGHGK